MKRHRLPVLFQSFSHTNRNEQISFFKWLSKLFRLIFGTVMIRTGFYSMACIPWMYMCRDQKEENSPSFGWPLYRSIKLHSLREGRAQIGEFRYSFCWLICAITLGLPGRFETNSVVVYHPVMSRVILVKLSLEQFGVKFWANEKN